MKKNARSRRDVKNKSEIELEPESKVDSGDEPAEHDGSASVELPSKLKSSRAKPFRSPFEPLDEESEDYNAKTSALDVLYEQGLAMTETIADTALTSDARDEVGVRTLFHRLHGPMEAVRHGDKESLRDHLVLLHAPLVEHCARNFLASGEPLDDLVQEGYVGLIKAVDRFDPDKGVRFSTYACHLITGEIRHYLRDLGRLIHEPGWHFELRQRISRTNDQLTQKIGRAPEPEDIARALNIEPQTVRDVLRNQQTLNVEYLDAESEREDDEGRGGDWEHKISGATAAAQTPVESQVEDQMMLGQALPQLRDLEKRAITMFFFEECTKTEIARRLDISVNHAAYLIKRGVEGLRQIIDTSETAVAAPEDIAAAQWQKPAMQQRTRAAYLLELAKGEAFATAGEEVEEKTPAKSRRGRPSRRAGRVAQVVPSSAVPASRSGVASFTEFATWVDDEVRRAARYGGEFALLWLRIQNWDEISALLGGKEKRALNSIGALTRRCLRATDKTAILSTSELPGLHVLVLMPHTGVAGEQTGQRWLASCNAEMLSPGKAEAIPVPQTDYALAIFPRHGKTADDMFRALGKHFQSQSQNQPQN